MPAAIFIVLFHRLENAINPEPINIIIELWI